eukprot:COSAG06_NODE_9289_length_1938_cov_1.802066_4_plen_147_part_01
MAKHDDALREQHVAALLVQRIQRGRRARVRLRREIKAAVALQSLCRSWLQHLALYSRVWRVSATVIQARWRGVRARQRVLYAIRAEVNELETVAFVERYDVQMTMATKLQSVWRGIQGRQKLVRLLHEDNAAELIQYRWRQHTEAKR